MPVVRELINRFSFVVNPSEKKNIETTISDMDNSFKGLLKLAKLLGAALSGAFIAGGKQLTDFEKKTSQINFFARNREEAEEIKKLFAELAEASSIISKKEGREAGALASQLNISLESLKEIAPLLAEIDIARTDLDFAETTKAFSAAVRGDLKAFETLIPGFKDIAENLSTSRFGSTFGDLKQQQRETLLVENILKKREEIAALGEISKETLTNAIEEVSESISDITFKFGIENKTLMIEAIGLANELVEDLAKSQPFWNVVGKASESIIQAIKFLRGTEDPKVVEEREREREKQEESTQRILKDTSFGTLGGLKKFTDSPIEVLDDFKEEVIEALDNFKKEGVQISQERARKMGPALEGTGDDFQGSLISGGDRSFIGQILDFTENLLKRKKDFDLNDIPNLDEAKEILEEQKTPDFLIKSKGLNPPSEKAKELNISVNGTIKVQGANNTELAQMSTELTEKIFSEIKTGFNNISAQNGSTILGIEGITPSSVAV